MNEYETAINQAGSAGSLFVAAAGNGVLNSQGYYVGVNIETYEYKHVPAILGLPSMITVANTNSYDQLSESSNYGPNKVHVAAPGELVTSTYPHAFTSYLSATGTSFSTPHVAAASALYWSVHPDLSNLQVKSRLLTFGEVDASLNGKVENSIRLNLGDLMNQMKGTRPANGQ
jgi:subtilisin family serine protease